MIKLAGWPLQRKIRIVRLKDSFVSKAVQHFLLLAPKKLGQVYFMESADSLREAGAAARLSSSAEYPQK
jgi:hypothetical protein